MTYPSVCIDRGDAVLHVGGNGRVVARPEPDFDEVVVTLHSVPSTARRVEGRAIAVLGAGGLHTAAVVAFAVEAASRTGHRATVSGHGAAGLGVESDLIDSLVIDALDLETL